MARSTVKNYVAKNTPIERINPLVKLYAVLCLGISAIIFPSCLMGWIMVCLLYFVAVIAKWGKQYLKIVLGFGIPMTIMLLFIQGLYSPKNKTFILDLHFAQLGLEGTLYALHIVGCVLVFLGAFIIMNKTTYTGKLVAALTGSGMNPKAGYLILSSLNVVPQMQRRMGVIQEAQEARGVEIGGSFGARIKAYVPLLGPVVLSSLTDAQERGMTLETRGFGIKDVKQTSYVEIPKSPLDPVLKVMCTLLLIITIIVTILMKQGII